MSHQVDETYDIYEEPRVKARKPHTCKACKETIDVGHHYFRVFVLFDGQKETIKRCQRCQAIHLHLRKKSKEETYGDLWPDELLNCGETYMDHWGEEPPDDIAALAFALQGETEVAP